MQTVLSSAPSRSLRHAEMFGGPVEYLPERIGDGKHILQDPRDAERFLGWKYQIELPDGIKDCV